MRRLFYLLLIVLCCISIPILAKEKKNAKETEAPKSAATITAKEMEQQFKSGSTSEDLLYIKLKDEQVEIYQGLAKDRSLRKQLIISLPNTEMLRLYTINKVTYEQMSRMLLDYEESNYNFNGYKIITDVDQPRTLENGTKVYRFWFMKIKREKASRRGIDFPIGIGIGIGSGHHHGPWIGVGW